jgi:hypothetical protein
MAITYYLVQLQPLVLFLLCLVVGGLFAGLGTYLFRKFVRIKVLRSHNEVTGFLFLAIASFYGLLLGFVIFIVWGQLNETHSNISKEGSSAMGLYREIKCYPDTVESKQLMVVYLDFVFKVVNDEIPKMRTLEPSRITSEAFNSVIYKMEHLNPKTPFQTQLVVEMFHHLNELATYRGLRTASIETEIPVPIWFPILLGAFITLLCAMMLDIEHARIHVILNTLLGIFIGLLLFVIILLDHPFTGSLGLQPQSYYQIFTLEQWTKTLPNPR